MDFSDYKGIYVVAELKEGLVEKVTGELLGEARVLADVLGETVSAVVPGHISETAGQELIALGADAVYVLDDPLLAYYDGRAYQKAVAGFLKQKKADTVIFSATSVGRDLAPRVAAELVCGVTADVTELSVDKESGLIIWSRPAMGGNIMADIISPAYRPQMGTVRPGTFAYPSPNPSRKGTVLFVPSTLGKEDVGTVLKEVLPEMVDETPLTEAEVIVAGGRGIHSREEWEMLRELAKEMGASLACSRPISELGWEPHSRQVGQTGQSVSPRIYMAFGISGAMQHLCGVNADVLIAVNKDKKAPIMDAADYAIVADAKEVIPLLLEKVRSLRKSS